MTLVFFICCFRLIHSQALWDINFQVGRQKASRKEDDSWFYVNSEHPDMYTPLIVPQDVEASRRRSLQSSLEVQGASNDNRSGDSLPDSMLQRY